MCLPTLNCNTSILNIFSFVFLFIRTVYIAQSIIMFLIFFLDYIVLRLFTLFASDFFLIVSKTAKINEVQNKALLTIGKCRILILYQRRFNEATKIIFIVLQGLKQHLKYLLNSFNRKYDIS